MLVGEGALLLGEAIPGGYGLSHDIGLCDAALLSRPGYESRVQRP